MKILPKTDIIQRCSLHFNDNLNGEGKMSRLSEIFSRLSPDSPGKKINRETVYRKFSRIPILETERTVLRRMKVTDTVDMFEYACQPCVTEYLLWNPHRDKDYTMRYLQYVQTKYRVGDFYDWAK